MQHLTGRPGRISLLLALFVGVSVAAPTLGSAQDTTDPDLPYTKIVTVTIPLPVITVQGTVNPKGVVDVKTFQIRALRGSVVKLACRGKHCPFTSSRRTMLTSTLRVKKLERLLKPAMTITLRIKRRNEIGKYTKYQVRKGKAPLRTDKCLDQVTATVVGCFSR